MSGVLRLALTCFAITPVQRWINGVGLLLLAVGIAAALTGGSPGSGRTAFGFLLIGMILIVLTPAFGGGVALRFASTRSVMNLRPHGRLRMLLGATLAITLLAALFTLPFLSLQWFAAAHGRVPGLRLAAPLDAFLVSWTALSLTWICMFALSRSVLLMALMGLIPVVVVNATKAIGPHLPSAGWMLLPGVVAWTAFALWYLRTDFIKRPEFPLSGDPSAGPQATPHGRLLASFLTPRGPLSREQTMRLYLFGSASPVFFALTGAWVALIFLAVQLFSSGSFRRPDPLVGMLPFIGLFNISLGYATARRVRLLWLRTDLDRAGLFRLAENWGQRAAMTTWLVAAAAVVLPMLLFQTRPFSALLVYVAMQGAAAFALYYGGMAMVRGWSLPDVLLCFLLALVVIAQATYFMPRREATMEVVAGSVLAAAITILLLRTYAAWCWHRLDWRVAKMSKMGARC